MRLEVELANHMKETGWTLLRHGSKHDLWVHTNGQKYTLPHRLRDNPRIKQNILSELRRLCAL